MKLSELLQEAPLSAILKGAFVAAGDIEDASNGHDEDVCILLNCKPTDGAYELHMSSPAVRAAAAAVEHIPPMQRSGSCRSVRIPGGAHLVIGPHFIITTKYNLDMLVA